MRQAAQLTLLTAAALFLVSSGVRSALASEPGPSAESIEPIGWLEVTPLDNEEPAELVPLRSEGRLNRKLKTTGRVIACHAFDEGGVACERILLDPREPLELARREGVPIGGSIHVGREALEGARVSLVPEGLDAVRFFLMPVSWDDKAEKLKREIVSDRKGRFDFPAIAPGRYLLEIQAPGGRLLHGDPFRVPAPDELRGPGAAADEPVFLDLGELWFDEGLGLEVLVTDLEGNPIEGARVGASQGARPEEARFFEEVADEAGFAYLSGLDPLLHTTISCGAPGFRWAEEQADTPPSYYECILEPLAQVAGTVLGDDGDPVMGAVVEIVGPSLDLPGGRPASQATSDDGAFEFVDLPAGPYRMTVAAIGRESAQREFEILPGEHRQAGEILLEAGEEWIGSVVDAITGHAIEGASVDAVRPAGALSTRTDEEGLFQAVTSVQHDLVLAVVAEGYARTTMEIPAEHLLEAEVPPIELTPGGRIRVSVWNAVEEAPCLACPVLIYDSLGGPTTSLRTEADGTALSESLGPGEYRVTLERMRSVGSVVHRTGGAESKRARVTALQTTEVRFGEEAEELTVAFRPGPDASWVLIAVGPTGTDVHRPSANGVFQVARPLGRAVLSLSNPHGTTVQQAVLPADFSRNAVELNLPRSEVTGSLSAAGQPLRAKTVSFVPVDPRGLAATSLTGRDGAFSVPFVSAGTYSLVIDGRAIRTFNLGTDARLELGAIELPEDALDETR